MATPEELRTLLLIAPRGESTDAEIGALLDSGSFNLAAATLWDAEAARTASLVDVTESGSSRKAGSVHTNAKAMAALYHARADAETAVTAPSNVARTRRMTR